MLELNKPIGVARGVITEGGGQAGLEQKEAGEQESSRNLRM